MKELIEDAVIPADSWIPVMIDLLKQGKQVKIAPHGFSMYPFLVSDRDEVILQLPQRPYKRGDVVLYRRDEGVYVLHRIHHTTKDKAGYYMLGDSQTWIEGPLRQDQVLALAVTLIRNGKEIPTQGLGYRFLAASWMRLRPYRNRIIKLWRSVRR